MTTPTKASMKRGWTGIAHDLMDKLVDLDLSARAIKLVLLVAKASFGNGRAEHGIVTTATLAEKLKVTPSTVRRTICSLVDADVLEEGQPTRRLFTGERYLGVQFTNLDRWKANAEVAYRGREMPLFATVKKRRRPAPKPAVPQVIHEVIHNGVAKVERAPSAHPGVPTARVEAFPACASARLETLADKDLRERKKVPKKVTEEVKKPMTDGAARAVPELGFGFFSSDFWEDAKTARAFSKKLSARLDEREGLRDHGSVVAAAIERISVENLPTNPRKYAVGMIDPKPGKVNHLLATAEDAVAEWKRDHRKEARAPPEAAGPPRKDAAGRLVEAGAKTVGALGFGDLVARIPFPKGVQVL